MIHDRDVRAKIAAVLRNEISVEDFARWIMSNSWNMHKDSSNEAVDLVSHIHLLLAERQDDLYSPREFRDELSSLLNNIQESVVAPIADIVPPAKFSGSNAAWVNLPMLERLPVSA